jgi:creatinine amidohydrolase
MSGHDDIDDTDDTGATPDEGGSERATTVPDGGGERATTVPDSPDIPDRWDLGAMTSAGFAALVADPAPFAVLLPVGSVEPHGPHLPLATDSVISQWACARAAVTLAGRGIAARIGPAVPFGVTDCAAGFAGAVSVAPEALTPFLRAIVTSLLAGGVDHVCLVNNHLEPAQDSAIRAAIAGMPTGRASVACPLTRRWARTLSDEFKRGACHAGRYETSIVMAAAPSLVDEAARAGLPEVPISLSDNLRAGITTFAAMGMRQAYAGAPAEATADEGEELLDRLAEMIATEVAEGIAAAAAAAPEDA